MGHLMAAAQRVIGPGNRLVATSTVEVDLASFLGEAPPDVLLGGCEPSKNAYGKDVRIPNMRHYPLRHMAGHIHISAGPSPGLPKFTSWALSQPHMYPDIVSVLDAFVGARAREIFNSQAYERRCFSYGQWGEYREQEYKTHRGKVKGLEYRTPGSDIWRHPGLVSFFLSTIQWVFYNLEKLLSPPMEVAWKVREMGWDALPGGKNWKWGTSQLPWSVPGVYNSGTIFLLGKRVKEEFISPVIDPEVWLDWGKRDWSWLARNINVLLPAPSGLGEGEVVNAAYA